MGRVSNPSVFGLTIGILSLAARVNVFLMWIIVDKSPIVHLRRK